MGDGVEGVVTCGLEGVVTHGLVVDGVRGGVECGVGGMGVVTLLGGNVDVVVDVSPEARGALFQA